MVQQTINFKIDGIDLIEKVMHRHTSEQGEIFNFNLRTQSVNPNDQDNLLLVFTEVNISTTKSKDLCARFLVGMGFNIESLNSHLIKEEDGNTRIPREFEDFFKMIAISTTRGIIFSELRGTSLAGAILPPIFAQQLVTQPGEGNLFDGIEKK